MANQIESYQRVIDIIASENFFHQAKDMILRIAKLHPQIVVDAYNVATSGNRYGVSYAVVKALLSGKKIEAIKEYRAEYSCDLRTAKDAVEEIIDRHYNLRTLFVPVRPCDSWKR